MIPISVLDLSLIAEGGNAARALGNTLDLAQHAELWGYHRVWLAEHHNTPGIASAATAVLVGHLAGATSRIRVGAGGVMLPNHSPLMVAEQFGTLETLYPGRIDLGLGRAPGTDPATAEALRRGATSTQDDFPRDVVELQSYLEEPLPGQRLQAVPGGGSNVPLWILGSSLFSAELAALLGLPYAFASHFAPGALDRAVALYRERFEPSGQLAEPYVLLGFNVFAAETDDEAQYLMSSAQQSLLNARNGRAGRLPAPVEDFQTGLEAHERKMLADTLRCSVAGSPAVVRRELEAFIAKTGANELMLNCPIHNHQARLTSYEIAARIRDGAGWQPRLWANHEY